MISNVSVKSQGFEKTKEKTKKTKVMTVLENREVMECLDRFVDNQTLGSLYNTCQSVRDNIDDLRLWRKRAERLAGALSQNRRIMRDKGLKETYTIYKAEESVHYRALCAIFQNNVEVIIAKIRAEWRANGTPPLLPEIMAAASLAHHGLLGSVECMWLNCVDLASVPAEHLASLASCVTMGVMGDTIIIKKE